MYSDEAESVRRSSHRKENPYSGAPRNLNPSRSNEQFFSDKMGSDYFNDPFFSSSPRWGAADEFFPHSDPRRHKASRIDSDRFFTERPFEPQRSAFDPRDRMNEPQRSAFNPRDRVNEPQPQRSSTPTCDWCKKMFVKTSGRIYEYKGERIC